MSDVYKDKLRWVERELTNWCVEVRDAPEEELSLFISDIRSLTLRIREVLD